jgi:RNA polymerase sigma-70 factor (ECF subfamily)
VAHTFFRPEVAGPQADLRRAVNARNSLQLIDAIKSKGAAQGRGFMRTTRKPSELAGPYLGRASRETSDEVLIRLISQRDRDAMQVLFARHYVKVYRFIRRLIGNASLAEDIVSEVFLDVWRRGDSFEGKSQVSTWLLAIARNKVLAASRRVQAMPLDDDLAASLVDPADGPETALNRTRRNAILRKCLERLSPAHREVIDLVYYHEKSVEEIAQIVGVSEGTVKSRAFYARRQIAELLRTAGMAELPAC